MQPMTSKERMSNLLRHQPVDRIAVYEHFWGDTLREWTDKGQMKLGKHEKLEDHFAFDMRECWPFNFVADMDFEPVVVEENQDTKLVRDGNGALLRRHKWHDTTPEHVDFLVKDRAGWEEHIKPKLTPDPRRINFEAYREAKRHAAEKDVFFCWSGISPFECMHPVAGHEYMLMGMALDPDWVRDMVQTYAKLSVALQEILFEQEGYPDGIWYYEDMGFKDRPFMSPAMYREIMQPGHTLQFDYAHSKKLPVIVHSCGYVEPLIPGLIEAGMDCLQVIEVKAGMDLLKLHREFGDRISFMGGIDVRTLYTNDRKIIDAELEKKIPAVMKGFNYMLHSDHSIPCTVDYDTFVYFLEKGKALGTY